MEKVAELQLEEMDYLDLFQLGFRPGYNKETALVMLQLV